jgi:hypothetical protein
MSAAHIRLRSRGKSTRVGVKPELVTYIGAKKKGCLKQAALDFHLL